MSFAPRRESGWLALVLWGFALWAMAGCGARQPAAGAVVAAPPLLTLAPAHARLAVHLRPRELMQHEASRALWEAFVDPAREHAFSARTGIEPRALFEVLFVEHHTPDSFMLIVRGSFDAEQAVRQAGEQLAVVDVQADRPRVRREGLRGEGRWAYVALAPDSLLVARDTLPSELAGLLGRYEGSLPSALPGDAEALAREHGAGPLVLLIPEPLALPGKTGAALLLSRQTALGVALTPRAAALRIGVDLRGEFPESAPDNFRALFQSLASSPLGASLGLGTALDSLRVQTDADGVRLFMSMDGGVLVRGLKLLFVDELSRLFD